MESGHFLRTYAGCSWSSEKQKLLPAGGGTGEVWLSKERECEGEGKTVPGRRV